MLRNTIHFSKNPWQTYIKPMENYEFVLLIQKPMESYDYLS